MVEKPSGNTAKGEEPEESGEKQIDTRAKKTPEVVSVKPIKYEVVSGTIGPLAAEEQDAVNARDRMFDATVPVHMEVEEKKEPRKKPKAVLTSSSVDVDQPDTETKEGTLEVIPRPEDKEQGKKMKVMLVTSSVSTGGSGGGGRVRTRIPTNEETQMAFAAKMEK